MISIFAFWRILLHGTTWLAPSTLRYRRDARSEQDVDLLLPPLMEIRVAEGITFMAQLHSTREPNDASLDEYGPTSQD